MTDTANEEGVYRGSKPTKPIIKLSNVAKTYWRGKEKLGTVKLAPRSARNGNHADPAFDDPGARRVAPAVRSVWLGVPRLPKASLPLGEELVHLEDIAVGALGMADEPQDRVPADRCW